MVFCGEGPLFEDSRARARRAVNLRVFGLGVRGLLVFIRFTIVSYAQSHTFTHHPCGGRGELHRWCEEILPNKMLLHNFLASQHHVGASRPARIPTPLLLAQGTPPIKFVNPLDVDGFAEPGGWRGKDGSEKVAPPPLLYFLPGMDGSLSTPFMQYPELATNFELSCLTHTNGLESRASFEELTEVCADEIMASARSGRQILLVGESFGATLAIAVAHRLQDVSQLRGLVLVNPATSYERSALARCGPICASLQGPLLYPLYILSLVAFATLVLTPVYQAPAFIAMLAATKVRSCTGALLKPSAPLCR